jgi:hypothetical protein
MSAPTQPSAGTIAIRPFTVPVTPDAELEALRTRVAATRWPERETVTDDSQGVPLAMIQELARYWAAEYDWRRCEAKRITGTNNGAFGTKPDGSPIELTGTAISAVRDDGMLLSNQVERNAFEVYKRLTAR